MYRTLILDARQVLENAKCTGKDPAYRQWPYRGPSTRRNSSDYGSVSIALCEFDHGAPYSHIATSYPPGTSRCGHHGGDEIWERRMATHAAREVAASGAELAPDIFSPGTLFEKLERGVFRVDAGKRGEGLSLVDFAAAKHFPGFTIETGMQSPLCRMFVSTPAGCAYGR